MSRSTPLSLCLTSVGKERAVISMDAHSSLNELYAVARSTFRYPDSGDRIVLQHGFPPTALPPEDDDATNRTLAHVGIQDQDRIAVVVVVGVGVTSPKTNDNHNNVVAPPPTTTRTRPLQRAAARAAADSFGDVIRAQDQLLQQQQQQQQQREHSKKRRALSAGRSSARTRKSSKLAAADHHGGDAGDTGDGRRLRDGKKLVVTTTTSAASAANQKRTKKSSSSRNAFQNEEDVSMALLNALNHNNNNNKTLSASSSSSSNNNKKVGQVLRGAMKRAIANRYEASRAVSKVTAVQSNQYTIQQQQQQNDDETTLFVRYSKGLEGRGMWEETVDCISREALEAVIAAIYNSSSTTTEREMLLPTTLAQVSPRVFWSLVWLYRDNPEVVTIEQCLSTLMPHLDWSFLHKRKRVLSEKAMENKRQQSHNDNDDDDEEAAREAVQAVESAMEQPLGNYDNANPEERRERAARAALSRHANETTATTITATTIQDEWQLVTPTERDDEELQECVATTTNGNHHQDVSTILAALHSLDIYNWRQLANARADAIRRATNVSRDAVERWMDYAQARSLEEMVVEICDGNANAVQALRDEARTGTIQDLSLWRHMPDLLHSSAPSLAPMGVGVEEVRTWCRRAQRVMEEWEWVQWYATPVE
jgi:hypothetical protein